MPHAAPAHKFFANRASLYQEITDKIIRELEQGRVPWVQPFVGIGGRRDRPARPAEECRHRPQLQWHQHTGLVAGLRRARLFRPKLAHLPAGAEARRPCAQGRTRHHGRLCRSLYLFPTASARAPPKPATNPTRSRSSSASRSLMPTSARMSRPRSRRRRNRWPTT